MNGAHSLNGNPPPSVSIICRTIGRPTLEEAIRSVRSQTHHPIELIVVDAAGTGSPLPGSEDAGENCRIVNLNKPLSRPEAANAGLEAASGDFILFLDDDDWIANDHVEQLLGVLTAQPDIGVAYSSTVKTTEDGTPTKESYGKAFHPAALRHDNFIPIHAALIRRSLIGDNVRFDETLEIFEDWDFWLELSGRTQFHHLDAVTAYYRAGGNSQTGSDDASHRYEKGHPIAKGRERLFDKWLSHWTGKDYNEALGDIDKEQRLSAELEKLNDERVRIKNDLENTRQLLEQTRASLESREAKLLDARNHAEHLDREIHRILHSYSWKITRPLRGLRQWLTLLSPRARKQRNTPVEKSNSIDE